MTKYEVIRTKEFKKAVKKLSKKDYDLTEYIINRLANGEILEPKYKDHALQGDLKGFRDCHIRPDLVLIYERDNDILTLTCVKVGSHSDVFKK